MALPPGIKVLSNPLFTAGHFSFQNPSAWFVARLLDAQPGCRIWDACSAPGGKTALLAESCPQASYVSSDLKPFRLTAMRDLSERLGLTDVRICAADAAQPPFKEVFDRILLDVPCSNLGVLGRRPEVLQRFIPREMDALPALQGKILVGAAQCLRPGGVLVYATCSPEPEETFGVVDAFLRTQPGFQLEDAAAFIPEIHVRKGCLLVQDDLPGFDRFFAARIRRVE
jgi:16S rRNA (cytosine967-C5)-methyltransferase